MNCTTAPAVLFDFDGTLADTAPDMVFALNNWLAARGRAPVAPEQVRGLCSGGSRALLNFCGIGEESMEAAVHDYLQCYEKTDYQNTVLFAGILPVLQQLNAAGIPWGVATNKPEKYFNPIAARLLAPLNPAVLIARNATLPAKPHPATLLAAAQQCNKAATQCVYVGDDLRDGQAALAAKMPFIAVTWGYWREDQWLDPDTPLIAALIATPELLLPSLAALPTLN